MANNNKHTGPNVPALRFPEFSGEWVKRGLSEYLQFKNGLNPDVKRFGKGIRFISVMDILNNAEISYDLIRASVNATEKEIEDFAVGKGDVLFQRSSETLEDVGRSNIYTDSRKCVFGGFVIRGKKIGEYEPYFMKYRLDSPNARKSIIVKGAGAQHFNIGQDGLKQVELWFPELAEQTKIGFLLKTIDERIATQSKIIEEQETLLKSLTDSSINALCEESNLMVPFFQLYGRGGEGGTPSTSERSFYDNGDIPFIKIDDLKSKYITKHQDNISESGLKNSSAWIIPENSVIYSNGATIGAVSINTYPISTKQGILGIVPKSIVNTEYLYYLMSSTHFTKEINRIITEGTMKTAYLKDINNIRCPLPPLDAQIKIAKGLASLSEKLEVEMRILEQYKLQKGVLLSKMFI